MLYVSTWLPLQYGCIHTSHTSHLVAHGNGNLQPAELSTVCRANRHQMIAGTPKPPLLTPSSHPQPFSCLLGESWPGAPSTSSTHISVSHRSPSSWSWLRFCGRCRQATAAHPSLSMSHFPCMFLKSYIISVNYSLSQGLGALWILLTL